MTKVLLISAAVFALFASPALAQNAQTTATAVTQNQTTTNNIVDVFALERSIDLRALPDGNVKGGYGEEDM